MVKEISAMSSSPLKLTYKDVWTKVSEFLGLGSQPTGDDLKKVKDITLRGYRKFLMPLDLSKNPAETYRWFFLQKTTTLSIVAGQEVYKLPIGFSSLVCPFTHITPLSYNPIQRPLAFIYLQKSQTTGTGYPRYFALKTSEYDPITGQADNEVIFFPTPSNNFDYYYTYNSIPPAPVNDDDVFVGDGLASECILECALAVAELQEDETIGIHHRAAEVLLQQCIGEDKKQGMVGNLGTMNLRKGEGYIRSATIYDKNYVQIIPEP